MAAQKAVAAWIVGAVAVAALAVGYGLGRNGDDGRNQEAGRAAPTGAGGDGPFATEDAGTAPAAAIEGTVAAESETASSEPEFVETEVAQRTTRAAARSAPALRATAPEPRDEPSTESPAAAELEEPTPDVAAAEPPRVTSAVVPAGTPLRLRLSTPASSQTSAVGDVVTAELTDPVYADDRIALPAGTRLRGRVVEVAPLRRIGGRSRLAIAFERAVADLETVDIRADWARTGKSETGKDAATIAAGAAAGTVIGNQAKKNDRGKILGGLIGAGIGAAVASKTPGEAIELPEGTLLEVELSEPVRITVELD